MTIINKGIFDTADVFLRQTGNDWPTAQVLSTSDITEGANLYFTNARVYAAVSGNLALKANVSDLTTANVSELTNLYYTNARVLSYVSSLLTTSNVAEGSNLYYTNTRVVSAVLPYLTSSNVAEGSNLYYTNTRVVSAILPYLTTSNVAEGSNLYYTNARVNSFIQGNLATKANVTDLTTANVSELTNLYYTNARVYSNVIALLPTLAGSGITIQANGQISANAAVVTFGSISQFLTTSNVSEGSNLYYTNARVVSAVLPYLTTSNVSEGSNLYYTNARVYANVIALLPTLAGSGITIQANGQISSNTSGTGTVSLTGLTTSNLNEGGNLYYTNARVSSNVIGLLPSLAGSGITVQANGQINANVIAIAVAATQSITIAAATTAYTLSRSVASPESILVINEGLIQIPTTDYTVSGTTLTTTTQYPVGSNLEIRYFGTTSTINSTTTVVGGVNPISFMLSGL